MKQAGQIVVMTPYGPNNPRPLSQLKTELCVL